MIGMPVARASRTATRRYGIIRVLSCAYFRYVSVDSSSSQICQRVDDGVFP